MVLGRMLHLLLEDHLVVLLDDELLEHQLGGDVEAPGLRQQVGQMPTTSATTACRNFALHADFGCGAANLPHSPQEAKRRVRGGRAKQEKEANIKVSADNIVKNDIEQISKIEQRSKKASALGSSGPQSAWPPEVQAEPKEKTTKSKDKNKRARVATQVFAMGHRCS